MTRANICIPITRETANTMDCSVWAVFVALTQTDAQSQHNNGRQNNGAAHGTAALERHFYRLLLLLRCLPSRSAAKKKEVLLRRDVSLFLSALFLLFLLFMFWIPLRLVWRFCYLSSHLANCLLCFIIITVNSLLAIIFVSRTFYALFTLYVCLCECV